MDEIRVLLNEVRQACARRGIEGIDEFKRMFKIYDKDKNNQLDRQELEQGLRKYGLNLDKARVTKLFNYLDVDKNGSIDFDEFLLKIRPPMSEERVQFITEVFRAIGGRAPASRLTEILKGHDRSLVTNTMALQVDVEYKTIVWEDFVNYYVTLSASIESDEYFKEMVKKAWSIDARSLLNKVRQVCVRRGVTGVSEFARMFKIYDKDKNNKLDQWELKQGLEKNGLDFDIFALTELFDYLDEDKNGSIDFDEFLVKLRPPMSGKRIQLVSDVYKEIGGRATNKNLIEMHSGPPSPTKITTLQKWGDSQVTLEDFLNYYSTLSASVDEDEYFEEIVKKAWKTQ